MRPLNSGWRYFPSRDADIRGLADVIRSPRYATAVGLLLDGREHFLRAEIARGQTKGLGNVGERMKLWFKANF